MERLRPGWFLEGLWDVEYQQYRLLAYLQKVRRAFLAQQLYPPLADLVASYTEAAGLYEKIQGAPSESSGVSVTLEGILTFALPLLEEAIEEGKSLYEVVAQALQVHVVGVVPLYRDEGYIFLRRGAEPIVRAYFYELRYLYDAQGREVAIRLVPVGEYGFSALGLGFAAVRERVLRDRSELPVPLTLAVEVPWILPLQETLLPIIQRSLPRWAQEAPTQGIG